MKNPHTLSMFAFSLLTHIAGGQTVLKINTGTTFFIAGPETLTLENVYVKNDGVLKTGAGSSAVLLKGNNNTSIGGAGSTGFHHLTHRKSGSANTKLDQNIEVTGNLTLDGGLIDLNGHDIGLGQAGGSLSQEGESSRVFSTAGGELQLILDLPTPSQVNPGDMGAVISSGANLGSTTVRRGHLPQATGVCSAGIRRYFNITPENNANLDATLRLYYFDAELDGIAENKLSIYRSDDGGLNWTEVGYDTRNSTENWVEKTGVSSLALFTLGSGSSGGCLLEFSGNILWEHDGTSGVKNATVKLSGGATGEDLTTDTGDFLIAVPPASGNFSLTPVKNINRHNGLTVADAVAIQQHVVVIKILKDAYKWIAADVNRSNSISTVDASLIRQSLLGNPAANQIFKTFWRFVPQSWTPTTPPWGFPEQINLTGVNTNQSGLNFYGVKIGDVVDTYADPADFGASELVWRVQDRVLRAGAVEEVEFRADQMDNVSAFQFALHFDPLQLQLESIEPLGGLPISMDHFGLFNVSEGEIRVVWGQEQGLLVPESAPVFRLRFQSLTEDVKLSEILQLQESILSGRVYNSALAESGVALRFQEASQIIPPFPGVRGPGFLQIRPNPFTAITTISFILPEACEASLRIVDVNGRLLYEQSAFYGAGEHQATFDFNEAGASGVLYCLLTTPRGVVTKRLVHIE